MPNQPYPRNIYPQISASLDTQQFVGKVGSAVTGNFQYGRSTWSEKWAVHPNELQLFVDDVLECEGNRIMLHKIGAYQ